MITPAPAGQGGEGELEGVVVVPVREVGDVVFANLLGEVFAGISVIAAPFADAVDAHQSDRKQLLPLLNAFRHACAFDFSPAPRFSVAVIAPACLPKRPRPAALRHASSRAAAD